MKPPLQDQEFALRGCAVIICGISSLFLFGAFYGAVVAFKWLTR